MFETKGEKKVFPPTVKLGGHIGRADARTVVGAARRKAAETRGLHLHRRCIGVWGGVLVV